MLEIHLPISFISPPFFSSALLLLPFALMLIPCNLEGPLLGLFFIPRRGGGGSRPMLIPGSLPACGGWDGGYGGGYGGSLREGKVYRVLNNNNNNNNSGPSSMSYGKGSQGGPLSEDIMVRFRETRDTSW